MLKLGRSRKTNTSEHLLLCARAFANYAIHNNRAILRAIDHGQYAKAADLAQRFDDDQAKTTKKWLY